MVTSSFDSLVKSMSIRKPFLLIGAGFSCGALDSKGDNLMIGKELSKYLYDKFYENGSLKSTDKAMLADIYEQRDNLKSICTFLRLQNKVKERNELLTRCFKRCSPNEYHSKLVNYPWEYIFTLNIDDVVEVIYRKAGIPLAVWDYSHPFSNGSSAEVSLIKLHGSVDDENSGYVFDEDEYSNYTITSCSILKEFAHRALQNDIVILGTQFQEDDLNLIIKMYESSGYSGDAFKRFFISPSISTKLRLQMEQSKNTVWIQSDAENFLKELEKNVSIPTGKRNSLKEKGVVFLDEINRQTPPSFALYKGDDVGYVEFFHNVDISPVMLNKWKADALSPGKSSILSFHGDSYIGKSCFAKRLLVELFGIGFVSCQLNRFDEKVFDNLMEYWGTLPQKTSFAIYIDNAAYEYKRIVDLKNMCPDNIDKIVIITEDTTENHSTKSYVLFEEPNYYEYKIVAEMNDTYAKEIFEKLSRRKRLGHYLKMLPPHTNPFSKKSRELIMKKVIEENDIIDALYYSSEGTSFQKHYRRWLDNKATDPEKRILHELCYLNRLGVTRIPNPLLAHLGGMIVSGFSVDGFLKKYSEVLSSSFGWIRLRRGRILNKLLESINREWVKETLIETAKYCVPKKENQKDEIATIFEKALRVKRIRNDGLLLREDILELFKPLEDDCGHISYFWVQYGIAAQINGKYEDANNHLMYAKNMRPVSNQVGHALAKNSMEWGLIMIGDGMDEGKTKFKDGSEKMLEIVYDRYRDFFRYAVHTYVSMWLRYVEIAKEQLSLEHCQIIANLLRELLGQPLDNMISGIMKKFMSYCGKVGYSSCCTGLTVVYKRYEAFHVEQEEYDVD